MTAIARVSDKFQSVIPAEIFKKEASLSDKRAAWLKEAKRLYACENKQNLWKGLADETL